MTLALRLGSLAVVAVLAACAPGSEDDADGAEQHATGSEAPKLCAAVRGNGEYVVTHFASLARIVEHYGVIDGIAGGSSGSLSTFVYDSIRANDAIGGDPARVALALKSLQGYGEALASSEEATEIGQLAGTVGRLKAELDKRGIRALISTDTARAASELKAVLSIPEVRTLVNPDAFNRLSDVTNLRYTVTEIYTSIATLGAFSVDDNRLFFRPGVLSWDGLSDLFGRVGDFYAGVNGADTAAQSRWLDACATTTAGRSWEDISATSCGEDFRTIVATYRAQVRAANKPSVRLAQTIGATPRLHKLVATSVLEGAAVEAYEDADKVYRAGTVATGSIPFEPSFADVKFGYWGSAADYAAVSKASAYADDLKTTKITSLGDKTWKEILTASPAEPGLSRFVKLPDGRYSAGGWSDLAPVLVLKRMGCDRVVYVTREGDESGFATKIAAHLGMNEGEWSSLYDLSNPKSSFTRSLDEADGVWCTNWNSFTSFQQRELAADSWQAPLETHAGWTGIAERSSYPNVTARANKPGCTPGVAGAATYPQL
ncbi:MAG: hypothetical protein KIT84_40765 [Labilithrix sp.]|nr:hypothetical protein [Labilithrix sp.]MCW5817402.1 hypothetical protein [Labilithrix sp.]